ncbi:hypothetical protein PGQ11_009821 [Apiospora arundinis]|uniref:Uncharacterized protein n=1 Tax=Apiospora arundinis TaxID=335852 RepID=A0ABR2I8E8_9PEZI
MSGTSTFTLAEILAVAKVHPFYSYSQYPPNDEAICEIKQHAALHPAEADLSRQPLLFKNDLYTTTERLIHDTSPHNTYRNNAYTSVTGGGGKSKPLFFATDALENRRQRARFGQFLRNIRLIQHGDWVLTTHVGGDLYRSLDLMLEIMENAGATSLAAGHLMSATKVVQLMKDFHINVLAGDGSQIIQVVHCISSLDTGRAEIRLDKIIYTSEALTLVQKSYIRDVLGAVKICSILGSAEAGPYGASSPDLVGPDEPGTTYTDFIIDTRATLIEVFPRIPQSNVNGSSGGDCPSPLPPGQTGLIVQTCLERLRNPLLRYVTGDVGSIQPLPSQARATIPESEWAYKRVLRLHGRDACSSFSWDAEYIEMDRLDTMLAHADLGILQWQVILDTMIPSKEVSLEIRLLRAWEEGDSTSEEVIVARIRGFFYMHPGNEHRFKVTFVKDRSGFELSPTGRKLVKLVDRSAG